MLPSLCFWFGCFLHSSFSARDDAMGREERGEKFGSRHLAAHCDSALACGVAWGLQPPGTSLTDTMSSACTGDPAVWLCSSSVCALYWRERQRPSKVFPLLGSDQQGASLVEGIHHWALTAMAPSSAWTKQGSEHVCRYTLSASNLESTSNKIHPLTTAQKGIVLISDSPHYLPTENSRFRSLNFTVSIQAIEI